MRSVAQWAVFAMLAGAEKRFFVGVRRPSQWREVGAFVGAVAEGLAFGLAARAPIIGVLDLNFDTKGSIASNVGAVMRLLPFLLSNLQNSIKIW